MASIEPTDCERWPQIDAVAAALLERGTLSKAEISDVIKAVAMAKLTAGGGLPLTDADVATLPAGQEAPG